MEFSRKFRGRVFSGLVLILTSLSSAQSLKVVAAPVRTGSLPAQVRIFCANNYTSGKCAAHAGMLTGQLSRYPVSQLKQWSFAIVPSDDWKQLVTSMSGNPNSPAFTILENRTTLFESALFESVASRTADLFKEFNAQGAELLDVAVTHELAHALCNDPSERRADDNAHLLRAQKPVVCRAR